MLDKLTYAGNLANLSEVEDSDRYDFVQGDICDPELTSKLVGRADAVVHFAAESHVDRSILGGADFVLTNVLGVALTVRATLPHLLERGTGHFVLTSSVAGRRSLPGSLYSATKWAVTAMGEAARQELDGTGVRVTLIEPGMVDTPFFDRPPTNALHHEDVAGAVLYAVGQPPHVDVNEILVRPTSQSG